LKLNFTGMKRSNPLFNLLFPGVRIVLSILCISIIGCEKDGSKKQTVVTHIEEWIIPDTVMVNEDVQIFVKVSYGCYNYDLFAELKEKAQFSYSLNSYGTSTCYGTCKCATAYTYKDTIIHFQPTREGTYLFAVSERKDKIVKDTMIVIDIRDEKRKKSVIGEWNWIRTEAWGWEFKVITTPESAGYSKSLKITTDSLKYYSGGVLDSSFSYGFKYVPIKYTYPDPGKYPDSTLCLLIDSERTSFFVSKNDTLILWSTIGNRGPFEYYKGK